MTVTPEFSRLLAVEGIIPDKVRTEIIEATAEECVALAERFDLRELSGFRARVNIRRVAGGTAVKLDGTLEADVVQACVVSLQDVHGHVEARFETYFTEDKGNLKDDAEFGAEDDEDAPEMAVNGMIDLGEVAAQYLSLELDPYPRAPGVSLAAQLAEAGMDAKNRPFQVLEGLREGKSGKDGKSK
jgi:uncharacterized metal-binding protein YceD (DUF177 family)